MTLHSLRAATLLAVVLATACGDAPTDPAALLIAEHARAALDVSVPLPSLAEAETMGRAEFDGVLIDLGVWLDAAEARLDQESPSRPELESLRAEVAAGRDALTAAARSEEDGDRGAAVAALLGAEAHRLRTTAYAVAERRIAAASAAEARCERGGDELDQTIAVRRGRRLLAHAREALAEDDFERALQRAYYSEALFAAECPALPGSNGANR
jgi:hypothetical protein